MTGLRAARDRKEIRFFAALGKAAPGYSFAWWSLLLLRGLLPSLLSLSFGWLVSGITQGTSLAAPLSAVGVCFTALVTLLPIHQVVSANLGDRMAAHLYDRLGAAALAPEGIGHLERGDLMNDLAMARDFDQGHMGPPMSISMDFITGGMLDVVVGTIAALLLFGFSWWAPPVLIAAWTATHWLLRESGVWKDRNTDAVRTAQRHSEYSYRLAVDAGPSKELRFFGLAGWVTERFIGTRTKLYELQYESTKLRERSLVLCMAIVLAANGAVFWAIASAARSGSLSTAQVVVYVQAAIGAAAIAFGGLNWALDGASAPVDALARLEVAMAAAGRLTPTTSPQPVVKRHQDGAPIGPEITFRDVTFAYDAEAGRNIFEHFDLTIPAGQSLAIVGQNGAGKTTLAKLICRLYDPAAGSITMDGVPLIDLDVHAWRSRVTAVFQDFIRFELSLRANVAPLGASDEVVRAALTEAGADTLADGNIDTVLSKSYIGGTDLSGGQWQRVALARALCAVGLGADVVLLDEPTAQLDVRGESEIFERVLNATKGCTTILISHRFSTVRLADRICVVEDGGVVEIGTHDELIERNGRYRTMFDLQASRFNEADDQDDRDDAHDQDAEVVHESL